MVREGSVVRLELFCNMFKGQLIRKAKWLLIWLYPHEGLGPWAMVNKS